MSAYNNSDTGYDELADIECIKLCVGPDPCDCRLGRVELVSGRSEIPSLSFDCGTLVQNSGGDCQRLLLVRR